MFFEASKGFKGVESNTDQGLHWGKDLVPVLLSSEFDFGRNWKIAMACFAWKFSWFVKGKLSLKLGLEEAQVEFLIKVRVLNMFAIS